MPVTNPCPDCGAALLRRSSKHKKGEFYWACSAYPECNTTLSDANGKPGPKKVAAPVSTEHHCPDCGKGLIQRNGIRKKTAQPYRFWSCSGFPACKAGPFNDVGGKPVLEAGVLN